MAATLSNPHGDRVGERGSHAQHVGKVDERRRRIVNLQVVVVHVRERRAHARRVEADGGGVECVAAEGDQVAHEGVVGERSLSPPELPATPGDPNPHRR